MSDEPEKCSRCGRPMAGPALALSLECAARPPHVSSLRVCPRCRESLNHWLAERGVLTQGVDGEAFRPRPHRHRRHARAAPRPSAAALMVDRLIGWAGAQWSAAKQAPGLLLVLMVFVFTLGILASAVATGVVTLQVNR